MTCLLYVITGFAFVLLGAGVLRMFYLMGYEAGNRNRLK